MAGVILGPAYKSFPPHSWGAALDDFLSKRPGLEEFATPLVTADANAMAHNVALLARWSAARGIRLAPHGKTTMAPALWRQVLDAGAWGLTLATGWQVQVARSFGVDRILLANELIDPVALRWLAAERCAHPHFEFYCWADSLDAVRGMESVLAGLELPSPVNVLVELGTLRGRTGARSIDAALAVAAAIAASRSLRLAGVGAYEGPITHDRSVSGLDAIGRYLDDVVDLHHRLEAGIGYAGLRPVVSAGGSAYFDLVAQHLAPLVDSATVVLRSGAYQVHDDGFYRGISPFAHAPAEQRFHAAMHGWARVLSRPEPRLAILDGGRRDFPFDEGLPTPQRIVGASDADSARTLSGSRVTKLNDQHTFLQLGEGAGADALPVGSVVRFGLSHPCTAFDKWRLMPVVDDASLPHPSVVDAVETYF
ncbi:amino acid deaminase [Parafrigoribacterium mesophilum]|uniref:amino acid deaminase n=1 Tax=Parafrigoribacterium mesophilum TaxID=433646 RepID=UPI0031FC61FD